VSEVSNFRDIRPSTDIEYKPSYDQFSHTTFQNNSSQQDRRSRDVQKSFKDIQIDPKSIVEGSQIPEMPGSGYTTEAQSVEKISMQDEEFYPMIDKGEYVRGFLAKMIP